MITNIKRILCPLDFSSVSKNALHFALQFADAFKAEIHLLHVIEPVVGMTMDTPHSIPITNTQNIEDARRQLRTFSETILTEVSEKLKHSPTLFSDIEIGSCGLTINDQAVQVKADIIIMGTRDKEHKSWWEGSIASEVLETPSIPILIVPEESRYEDIERLSFATDLHRGDLLHLLEVMELLRPLNPEIRCIHVVEEEKKQTEIELEELIQAFSHQIKDINITFHQLEEENTTEALEAFNLVYHVDLQILVKPKRNFLSALFHRSQSKETAKYTHIPLLVMPG